MRESSQKGDRRRERGRISQPAPELRWSLGRDCHRKDAAAPECAQVSPCADRPSPQSYKTVGERLDSASAARMGEAASITSARVKQIYTILFPVASLRMFADLNRHRSKSRLVPSSHGKSRLRTRRRRRAFARPGSSTAERSWPRTTPFVTSPLKMQDFLEAIEFPARRSPADDDARRNFWVLPLSIEFAHVYKTFDRPVLDDVSFHVDAGETLAIIGRSGRGQVREPGTYHGDSSNPTQAACSFPI